MIAFIVLLAFELGRNWFVIQIQKQEPDHARGWGLRILVVVIIGLIKFDFELQPVYLFGWEFLLPVTSIIYSFGCGLAFWFPFDVALNKMRGKVWNHSGTKALLDRFNLPGDLEWVIKFLLMVLGIYLILPLF